MPPGRLRSLFLIVLAVLLTVTAFRYYAKAEKPSRTGELSRTAFLRWRSQIQDLESGVDIYRAHQYPNPPIMALILYPLTKLPPLTGALTWFMLKVGFAGIMVLFAFRLMAFSLSMTNPDRRLDAIMALAILSSLHPILGDLSHGNVNIFIGFLVLLSLDCYRRGWDFTAGLTLALAIACKVTPALFVPYFLWKRSGKVVGGVVLGLVLWVHTIPGAVLGWEFNQTLVTSWFDVMVRPFVIDGKVTSEHPNQSIPGLLFRLLTKEPSFIDFDEEDRPVASEFHTLVDLGPTFAKAILHGLQFGYLGILLIYCRPSRHSNLCAGPRLAAECAFIVLGMLLFSERTWKHHSVIQILPMVVLWWAVLSGQFARSSRRFIGLLLGIVFLLTLTPSLLNTESQDLAMVYGCYTIAWLLELLGIVWILSDRRVFDGEASNGLASGERNLQGSGSGRTLAAPS